MRERVPLAAHVAPAGLIRGTDSRGVNKRTAMAAPQWQIIVVKAEKRGFRSDQGLDSAVGVSCCALRPPGGSVSKAHRSSMVLCPTVCRSIEPAGF